MIHQYKKIDNLHQRLRWKITLNIKLHSIWYVFFNYKFIHSLSHTNAKMLTWWYCWLHSEWKSSSRLFNLTILSYQYRNSSYKDKTVWRPSYLYNGIPTFTGKKTSLYWVRALYTARQKQFQSWAGTTSSTLPYPIRTPIGHIIPTQEWHIAW